MNVITKTMKKLQTGFTLVELMITLVIAAILLSMAVPSFITTLQNNRIVTQANNFVTSLNIARSEAIKRGARITVCKSADNASCTGAGSWNQGWIIFVDANSDAAVNLGEELIRAYGPIEGGNTLNGTGNVANYISYVNTGFSQLTSGGLQSGEIVLCDDRGFVATSRVIILSATGQIRPVPTDDAAVTAAAC